MKRAILVSILAVAASLSAIAAPTAPAARCFHLTQASVRIPGGSGQHCGPTKYGIWTWRASNGAAGSVLNYVWTEPLLADGQARHLTLTSVTGTIDQLPASPTKTMLINAIRSGFSQTTVRVVNGGTTRQYTSSGRVVNLPFNPPGGGAAPPQPSAPPKASVVSGSVLVRVRGTTQFRPLRNGEQIPSGTTVDASRGRVRLRGPAAATQTADFYQGLFRVTRTPGALPVTVLTLTGGNFAVCGSRAAWARTAASPRVVRKLWGNGKGRFRSVGASSSATVRGTIWLTEDRCDGTLVAVKRGVVAVFDRVRRRTVIVRAGHSVLVRRAG